MDRHPDKPLFPNYSAFEDEQKEDEGEMDVSEMRSASNSATPVGASPKGTPGKSPGGSFGGSLGGSTGGSPGGSITPSADDENATTDGKKKRRRRRRGGEVKRRSSRYKPYGCMEEGLQARNNRVYGKTNTTRMHVKTLKKKVTETSIKTVPIDPATFAWRAVYRPNMHNYVHYTDKALLRMDRTKLHKVFQERDKPPPHLSLENLRIRIKKDQEMARLAVRLYRQYHEGVVQRAMARLAAADRMYGAPNIVMGMGGAVPPFPVSSHSQLMVPMATREAAREAERRLQQAPRQRPPHLHPHGVYGRLQRPGWGSLVLPRVKSEPGEEKGDPDAEMGMPGLDAEMPGLDAGMPGLDEDLDAETDDDEPGAPSGLPNGNIQIKEERKHDE